MREGAAALLEIRARAEAGPIGRATAFRIFGGALGEAHAQKIHKIMDMAIQASAPLVSLNDGAGARIQEGVTALAGYGGIYQRNTRASGVIPQISVMLGPCAGGAAYSPALTDFICLEEVRFQLSMLPQNNRETPPAEMTEDPADRRCEALLDLVPADGNRPYDMRKVIEELADEGRFMEIRERWATNQEHGGIIRHGAKLLYAYCNATVPRISLVLRTQARQPAPVTGE